MPATERHSRCLEAIRNDIAALGLTGMSSSHVVTKKIPPDRNIPGLPAIVVSYPGNEGEQMVGGLNQREDVGWPAMITILAEPATGNANVELDAAADRPAEASSGQVCLRRRGLPVTG